MNMIFTQKSKNFVGVFVALALLSACGKNVPAKVAQNSGLRQDAELKQEAESRLRAEQNAEAALALVEILNAKRFELRFSGDIDLPNKVRILRILNDSNFEVNKKIRIIEVADRFEWIPGGLFSKNKMIIDRNQNDEEIRFALTKLMSKLAMQKQEADLAAKASGVWRLRGVNIDFSSDYVKLVDAQCMLILLDNRGTRVHHSISSIEFGRINQRGSKGKVIVDASLCSSGKEESVKKLLDFLADPR